jgi:hypothetical protein
LTTPSLLRLLIAPILPDKRTLCSVTVRNPRGRHVGVSTTGQGIYVDADAADLQGLDVLTEVAVEDSAEPSRVTIVEYYGNDPPKTSVYDILVGVEPVVRHTVTLEPVAGS